MILPSQTGHRLVQSIEASLSEEHNAGSTGPVESEQLRVQLKLTPSNLPLG